MADTRTADKKPKGSGNPNRINRLLVKTATTKYKSLSGLIMLQNLNLNSEQTLELRQALRAKNCRLRMVRSRVTKRALGELGLKDASGLFVGPTCVLDGDDPVSAAKVAMELVAKYNKALKLTGGVLEGKVLPAKDVEVLSKSKSQPELIGDVVGLAKSPGARVAGAIKALVEKLEKAEQKA